MWLALTRLECTNQRKLFIHIWVQFKRLTIPLAFVRKRNWTSSSLLFSRRQARFTSSLEICSPSMRMLVQWRLLDCNVNLLGIYDVSCLNVVSSLNPSQIFPLITCSGLLNSFNLLALKWKPSMTSWWMSKPRVNWMVMIRTLALFFWTSKSIRWILSYVTFEQTWPVIIQGFVKKWIPVSVLQRMCPSPAL